MGIVVLEWVWEMLPLNWILNFISESEVKMLSDNGCSIRGQRQGLNLHKGGWVCSETVTCCSHELIGQLCQIIASQTVPKSFLDLGSFRSQLTSCGHPSVPPGKDLGYTGDWTVLATLQYAQDCTALGCACLCEWATIPILRWLKWI